jgi:hypothetical protein
LIKGVKSEGKTYEKAKSDGKDFVSLYAAHINSRCLALSPLIQSAYQSPFHPAIAGPRGKEK